MSAPPAKRQRANSSSSTPPADLQLATGNVEALIAKLTPASLQLLLLSAALAHEDVRDSIAARVSAMEAAQRADVVDLDEYSKTAWHAINTEYVHLSGSKQYVKAPKAYQKVVDCIEEIGKAAGKAASLGTKKSALLTLRKIGKTVCLGEDVVGREVKKDFQWDSRLQDYMVGILRSMGPDELDTFRSEVGDEFLAQLEELEGLATGCCIFEGLEELTTILTGKDGEEDEEDNDRWDEGDDDSVY